MWNHGGGSIDHYFQQYCLSKAKLLTYFHTTKLYSQKMINRIDPVICRFYL